MRRSLLSFSVLICLAAASGHALAISRDEVMVRAQGYAYHPWTCGYSNMSASCATGYQSAYTPGDYFGLPYDWGGYVSLFQFDKGILDGKGAGSYSSDGVLSCTAGLDCSGFVSKAWAVGHFGTATFHNTSYEIGLSELKKADALNVPGYHIVLFGGKLQNNWPFFYEAINYNTQINMYGGWAYVSGFTPIRGDTITDYGGGPDLGTQTNPIKVTQFPFVHNGDTSASISDMFDACGANDSKTETGPEVIYELTIDKPGTLTVQVQDDAGVDIDVHVYSNFNTYDCVARHDTDIQIPNMACGTWYVIADTWANSGGTEFPGPYTITIDFQNTGSSCSQWVEEYEYNGLPGEECGYTGAPNLPFCNPNLGAQVCLFSDQPGSSFSFCSYVCQSDSDCQGDFPNGCCADIAGSGDAQDFFCLEDSFCGPVTPPPVDEGPDPIEEVKVDHGTVTPPDLSVEDTVKPEQDVPQSQEELLSPEDNTVASQDSGKGGEDDGLAEQDLAHDDDASASPGTPDFEFDQSWLESPDSGSDGCSAGPTGTTAVPLMLFWLGFCLFIVRRFTTS